MSARLKKTLMICCLFVLTVSSCSLFGGDDNPTSPDNSTGGGSETIGGTFNAAGSWNGKYTHDGKSREFTARISQTGTTISGTISIPSLGMDNAAISGTVSGSSVKFGDIASTVSFSGSAKKDDTAEGTYSLTYNGSTASGAWTGTCVRFFTLVRTIVAPDSGNGLAWDGSSFWVSSSQKLDRLSPNGVVQTTFIFNGAPLSLPFHDFGSLTFDGSMLWAVEESYDQARILAISASDGSVTTTIPAPPDGSSPNIAPSGLGLGWDGSYIWCLRYGDGKEKIYKIDRSSGTVLSNIPLPSGGDGRPPLMPGGFTAAGNDLWISDRTGYLYLIRSSDGRVMRRFDFKASIGSSSYGALPGAIAWDGSLLWVMSGGYGDTIYGFSVPTGLVQ